MLSARHSALDARHLPRTPVTLGTRGSPLARWQTDWVLARLRWAWPELRCETKLITTTGDRVLDKPLPEIGGKGLFTEELECALRSGEIDLAVHSLKDLPIEDAPGLVLGAICAREDARDVLIARDASALAGLPDGARVGTSSLRRSAQLLAARPDVTVLPLRGNVDTRVRKALRGDYDAIVLAAAGVLRLGLGEHIAEYLPFEVMLPAPGQGALAVQCRADDDDGLQLLAPLDDHASRAAVTAERTFLKALGGGCSAPVAAFAESRIGNRTSIIAMTGLVASPDGRRVIRVSGEGDYPTTLGAELARQALAQGARELLR
ncbi:MAG: hydroxymethylbilane synthase [Chloroflexi bacterium]|nr:hydroxymethylbilane synthase [Chloroflexota bacterium]